MSSFQAALAWNLGPTLEMVPSLCPARQGNSLRRGMEGTLPKGPFHPAEGQRVNCPLSGSSGSGPTRVSTWSVSRGGVLSFSALLALATSPSSQPTSRHGRQGEGERLCIPTRLASANLLIFSFKHTDNSEPCGAAAAYHSPSRLPQDRKLLETCLEPC